MSMFKNIFGSSDEQPSPSKVNWVYLTKLSDLDVLNSESNEKMVLIFKHSTRCSISRMVLKQFENEFNVEEQITPYFLDLLNHREVSNEIADRFGVYHQSPQLLVIKEGKSIFDASHESIDASDLKQFV